MCNTAAKIIEERGCKTIYDTIQIIADYIDKMHHKLHENEFLKVIHYLNKQLQTIVFLDLTIDGYDNVFYTVKTPFIYYYNEILRVDYTAVYYADANHLLSYDLDYVIFRGKLYEI